MKKPLLPADKNIMKNTFFKSTWAGFTTIELIIVATIITILTTLAVPSYLKYLANNRATNLALQINAALRLAKSEALHRRLSVALCAISTAGGTACNNTASSWQFGWQVSIISTSTIMYTYVPNNTTSGITITPASNIIFSPNGFPSPQAYTITIKPKGCTQGYIISFNATAANGQLTTQTTTCP